MDVTYFKVRPKERKKNARNCRQLCLGRILTRASQCDRRHGTQELRILAYQENVRNLALAYTQAWNLALIRPLGSLALKEQDIWELESIMGPQIGIL